MSGRDELVDGATVPWNFLTPKKPAPRTGDPPPAHRRRTVEAPMTRYVPGHVGVCDTCGKRRYPTRKAAKKVARQLLDQPRMSPYRCGDWWHLGHLPKAVIKGIANRDQIINHRSQR